MMFHSNKAVIATCKELPLLNFMYNHFLIKNEGCNIVEFNLKFKYPMQQYHDIWIEFNHLNQCSR